MGKDRLFFQMVQFATVIKVACKIAQDQEKINQGAKKVANAIKQAGVYEQKIMSIQKDLPVFIPCYTISDTVVKMAKDSNVPVMWIVDLIEESLYYARDSEMLTRFKDRLGIQ